MAAKKSTKKNIQVAIIMGSDSDYPTMEPACQTLAGFGISYEVLVASAHRTPDKVQSYARQAKSRGIKIIIAGAGAAAHLAGVLAAETPLPIIGVPIASSALQGIDSLLSTAQMPGGVSVATMAIGKAGAKNAGLFATQILSVSDANLFKKLIQFRKNQAKEVEKKNQRLQDTINAQGS